MIINEFYVQVLEKCFVVYRLYYDIVVYYSRQLEDVYFVGNVEMNEKYRRYILNRRQVYLKNKEGVECGNIVEVMCYGVLMI